MTTEPATWPGASTSLGEEVSESWDQCEENTTSHVSLSLRDKRAPRAEPEEDIDDFRVGVEDDTQELAPSPRPTGPSQARVGSEELVNVFDASPRPPAHSALSVEESLEKEVLSSLEGEVDEFISDAEIVSDPSEDISSPDSQSSQEWTLQLTDAADGQVDPAPEEKSGDETTTEESSAQGNLPGELENNTSDATSATPNDTSKSYDACSPPFADESEEDDEDLSSCQQQRILQDISGKTLKSHTATLPAVLSAPQQAEPLPENRCQHAPMGGNQEAAQQVLGQSSAPLSAVAMEPPDQGGAAFEGSGCAVAARERQDRAGKRAERESKTGDEGGQKASGHGRNKVFGREHGAPRSKTPQIREWKTEKYIFKGLRSARMESDCGDDSQSDSGVSADFSPCSTWENSTPQGSPPNETPIEREIRRSMEREQSLRRLRGLPTASPQYVEIPIRKIMLKPTPSKAEKGQGKDRHFAGKKMQQEIHKEAKREQDLVKIGKVPGGYDRGTVPQLKERKELFEAFQKPSDSASTASRRSRTTSRSSSVSEVSLTAGNQENAPASRELLSPNSKTGGPGPSTPRRPSLSGGKGQQVIIVETCLSVPVHERNQTKPGTQITAVNSVNSGAPRAAQSKAGETTEPKPGKEAKEVVQDEEEEEVPKENPFFKLRSSTSLIKVEKDIREAKERENELRKQRMSLYGGRGGAQEGRGGRSASMDSKSPTLSAAAPENGPAAPDLPGSPSKAETGSPAVCPPAPARSSHGKLAAWPPAQSEEDKPSRPEVPRSPNTPRQKTPLVQRWESGLINGCNQGDD